jgi:hypothetical protein
MAVAEDRQIHIHILWFASGWLRASKWASEACTTETHKEKGPQACDVEILNQFG